MRTFSKIIFGIITALAVIWIIAPDIVSHLVHNLPKNSVQLSITPNEQRFHFSHSATGTAWLLWTVMLLLGWRMKKWGRGMLGLSIPVGLLGGLPLLPFVNLSMSSAMQISRRIDWTEALILVMAILVLTSKALVVRYWFRIVDGRSKASAD